MLRHRKLLLHTIIGSLLGLPSVNNTEVLKFPQALEFTCDSVNYIVNTAKLRCLNIRIHVPSTRHPQYVVSEY